MTNTGILVEAVGGLYGKMPQKYVHTHTHTNAHAFDNNKKADLRTTCNL